MKSRIKSKKPIKFGKSIEITSLASPNVSEYEDFLKKQNPNITQDDLNKEILNMVKRDTYYNLLMDEVSSAYEFELSEDEVKERMDLLAQSKPDIPAENLRGMAEIPIYKKLIYEDLEKDWEVLILDDMVRESLEQFYKSTGQPIREYLMDKSKFEEVRATLVEQTITERLMNAFNAVYRISN